MEVDYLDEWIIITLHVAGFLHQAIFEYFHQSSDKSGLKVTDCTVQSAEYWCSDIFFFFKTPNFGSIFQTQSRGTHCTSPTSLTSKDPHTAGEPKTVLILMNTRTTPKSGGGGDI